MKAISPLIATVVLVAFTLAVAIIVTGTFTSLTKTQVEQASSSSSCPGVTMDILSKDCNNDTITIVALAQKEYANISLTAIIGGAIYINTTPEIYIGDALTDKLRKGQPQKIKAIVGTRGNGSISKLVVSAGNCPGYALELTNGTADIGTCS